MKKNLKQTIPFIALFVIATLLVVQPASAKTTDSTKININLDKFLTFSVSNNNINFAINNNDLYQQTIELNASTNNPSGYRIGVQTTGDDNNLNAFGNAAAEPILGLAEPKTVDNFPLMSWGYTTDSENKIFQGVPLNNTDIFTTSGAGYSNHQFTIGAKVNLERTVTNTNYSNGLLFSVIANPTIPAAGTLETITSMQEMTPDVCLYSETPLETDKPEDIPQYQLVDERDNKTYWVTKLPNGTCWMTQNLDFDLDENVALTSNDTDLNTVSEWTPLHSTVAVDYSQSRDYDSTDSRNEPFSYDPGEFYESGISKKGYSQTCTLSDWEATKDTNCVDVLREPSETAAEHGHFGNYYNWPAAVASNDGGKNALEDEMAQYPTHEQNSICPKGWRLPYNGSPNSTQEMMEALSSMRSNISAPMYLTRNGYYSSRVYEVGYEGYYWTATVPSAYNINYPFLHYIYETSRGTSTYSSSYGATVRCIARSKYIYNIVFDTQGGSAKDGIIEQSTGLQAEIELPKSTPIKKGYDFIGWSTQPNSDSIDYRYDPKTKTFSPSTVTIVSGNGVSSTVKLYAVYKEGRDFDAAYAENGKSTIDVNGINYYAMQDMNNAICSMVSNGTSGQLADRRDNKIYWVTKMIDGNCWMTQNLDLDIPSEGITLSADDSDVTESRTIVLDNKEYDDLSISQINFGNSYVVNDEGGRMASAESLAPDDELLHYHIGNMYTWNAAIASSGENLQYGEAAPDSICPKGWALPISSGYTEDKSFGALTEISGITTNGIKTGGSYSNRINRVLTDEPFYITLSGYGYYGNSVSSMGEYNFYWGRNRNRQFFTDYSYISTSSDYVNLYSKLQVRCVAK